MGVTEFRKIEYFLDNRLDFSGGFPSLCDKLKCHKSLSQAQSQPCAAILTAGGSVNLLETVEYAFLVFLLDTDTSIGY